jgi:hypothetical protein
MKQILLLIGAASLLTACGTTGPQPDFHVNLTLRDAEESEDSNSITETIVLDGYEGTYTWTYDGYHPDDENFERDRKYYVKLNVESLQELNLLLRENGLLVNRDAIVSTGEPWSSFDVSWTIAIHDEKSEGHVVGEAISWEDYRQTEDQMMPDESYYAAQQVMGFIQEQVGFELD